MLDIYICIISCIILSDLLPDIYFHDTDTWDLCDMHYVDYIMFLDLPCYFILWYRVLMILWLYYTTVSRSGHLISLYICHTMHARSPCTWSIVSIFLLLLLLSVLDTAIQIVLFISMSYFYCYCIFIFSLLLFFSFVYS